MSRFHHQYLILISLLLTVATGTNGQSFYPYGEDEIVRCNVMIEMKHGYISGICVMQHRDDSIVGSIFNEFGISAIDFSYDTKEDKVELEHVIGALDRRLIKHTIRGDIKEWLHALKQGNNKYVNTHRDITYTLMPMDNNGIIKDETER